MPALINRSGILISAVRLTHYPTGIVVYSQTEKSQLQNKAKAFALLRAKLYDIEQQKAHDAEAELRKSQIRTVRRFRMHA